MFHGTKSLARCPLGQVEWKVACRADGWGQGLPPRPVQTGVLGDGGGGGRAGGPGAGRTDGRVRCAKLSEEKSGATVLNGRLDLFLCIRKAYTGNSDLRFSKSPLK